MSPLAPARADETAADRSERRVCVSASWPRLITPSSIASRRRLCAMTLIWSAYSSTDARWAGLISSRSCLRSTPGQSAPRVAMSMVRCSDVRETIARKALPQSATEKSSADNRTSGSWSGSYSNRAISAFSRLGSLIKRCVHAVTSSRTDQTWPARPQSMNCLS